MVKKKKTFLSSGLHGTEVLNFLFNMDSIVEYDELVECMTDSEYKEYINSIEQSQMQEILFCD